MLSSRWLALYVGQSEVPASTTTIFVSLENLVVLLYTTKFLVFFFPLFPTCEKLCSFYSN